jgi:2-oxoisovalerate dehydrogenase E2 component (dihydrolipoyl transacylase)
MKTFRLPDLGEGLQEAEIRQWHVKVGDQVQAGDNMVSVETDKAIVDIPAPWDGVVQKLFAETDDELKVGDPLIGFEGETEGGETEPKRKRSDSGTVVGNVAAGSEVVADEAESVSRAAGGIKAVPAVRALAKRLDVDLTIVTPTGPDGLITARDVERAHRVLNEAGPLEKLRGPRRAMARSMAQAHAEVADVTITEEAILGAWYPGDVTMRLIRAVVAGCRAEPALNAWYDSHVMGRRLRETIDLGIAVDTEEGLFVPVLRDVANRSDDDLRAGLERLKADVRARTIPAEELRGYTFTLSNYGLIGGLFSNPIVVPPCVGILGAGRIRKQIVPIDDEPAIRPVMSLSLTFDHRCVTGGEGARFLNAVVGALEDD